MFDFLRHWFSTWFKHPARTARTLRRQRWQQPWVWLLCVMGLGVGLALSPVLVRAQTAVQQQEDQVIREYALPRPTNQPPVYRPQPSTPRRAAQPQPAAPRSRQSEGAAPRRSAPAAPSRPNRPAIQERPAAENRPAPANPPEQAETAAAETPNSRYELTFNRSPVVGNRLRLEGVYPETRLGFTRPRNWQVQSAKALIRFQHSPSLLPDRSNLIVRVNDTSVGSIPLNRQQAQVGQALFNIPANLIQDFNEISILAEQQTSETCTNPTNPMLWTEILPDSKLLVDYKPQDIPLDFSRYPYPFLDDLSLDPAQFVYLRPKAFDDAWLTAAARFQAAAGRSADFRPINARLVDRIDQVKPNERLIVIGTPAAQPALNDLTLDFDIQNSKILDGNGAAFPGEVGLLMLTSIQDGSVPVLVASGNDAGGVLKAVQFLVQTQDSQIGAGRGITVPVVNDVPTPSPRQWSGYLPVENAFRLSDLSTLNRQPFEDVTVHGTNTPPIAIPFKALPDDRFLRGSTMTLQYSYSPQVDPRTSAVEVRLDGVTIGSKRLTSAQGGRESLKVNLPENLIAPDSRLDVQFVLHPRRAGTCGLVADQQLWGTVHTDTSFNLKRDSVVRLPDLKLLQTGYPLTAPQDLSSTAVALPNAPTTTEVETLLALSERLGRTSRADSVKLQVYQANTALDTVRREQHLVGIGTRDRFPFPEVFDAQGFNLQSALTRRWQQSQIQTLPDDEGVIKQILSPWNADRLLLALTSQSEKGLAEVQEVFDRDQLFSQLRGDTVLVSRNQQNPSAYDASGYTLEFLEQTRQRQIERTGWLNRVLIFLQDYWFAVPTGIVLLTLLLYSISQLYLNRLAKSGDLQ